MRHAILLAAAAALPGPGPALAGETHLVVQVAKRFSPDKLTIAAGDTILFRNADGIDHHVISYTPSFAFDLGLQHPGDEGKVTFGTPGTVIVSCDLHSRMEVEVTVE